MESELYPVKPILLVDDETPWLRSLSLTLREGTGINNILKCSDSRDVISILRKTEVSLILLDLTMPHLTGHDLLPMISKDFPEIPVIIMSGLNQIETAVRCMQHGACDYLVKSVDKNQLFACVNRAFTMQDVRNENQRLKSNFLNDTLEHSEAFAQITTCCKKMRAVMQYCEAVAQSSEPILITGESGIGKELIAQAVHKIRCPDGPWVAVNVAGLDDNVFSDTLFGHTKGAFTGADRERNGMIEGACGGSLFLDEIGDLNFASQVKLLRLLQEGEYFQIGCDVPRRLKAKLIFATNHNLACDVENGTFRKDLYYRLNAHQIRVPALRERLDDLPLLIDVFLEEAARSFGKKTPTVPKELITLLSTYHFPGNVRELRAMVFNAVSLHQSRILSLDTFKEKLGLTGEVMAARGVSTASDTSTRSIFPERLPNLDEVGRQIVSEAMLRAHGNQSLAASMLGITRQGLAKRLKNSA